jgi:2-oxo-4-hydroxy-4-carboxy-5-ureidoimidazoline decarboxylase
MTLDQLNRLSPADARSALERCCGSRAWVERMRLKRPFAGREALFAAAESAADALGRSDWLEAFGHHPRIGDREALRARFATTGAWAEQEQAGAAGASEEVLAGLEQGNRAYAARFGYGFIVCATGRSADEMLAILTARLENDPELELVMAAQEQRAITRLRLEKLLSEGG